MLVKAQVGAGHTPGAFSVLAVGARRMLGPWAAPLAADSEVPPYGTPPRCAIFPSGLGSGLDNSLVCRQNAFN